MHRFRLFSILDRLERSNTVANSLSELVQEFMKIADCDESATCLTALMTMSLTSGRPQEGPHNGPVGPGL